MASGGMGDVLNGVRPLVWRAKFCRSMMRRGLAKVYDRAAKCRSLTAGKAKNRCFTRRAQSSGNAFNELQLPV
jgi:hypothetical protein